MEKQGKESGKKENPINIGYTVKVAAMEVHWDLRGSTQNASNNCPPEGWEVGAFIHQPALHRLRFALDGINCPTLPDLCSGQVGPFGGGRGPGIES